MIGCCSWHAVEVTLEDNSTCKSLGLSRPPLHQYLLPLSKKLCLLHSWFFLTLNWNWNKWEFWSSADIKDILGFDGVQCKEGVLYIMCEEGSECEEMWCKTRSYLASSLGENHPGFRTPKPFPYPMKGQDYRSNKETNQETSGYE